MRTVPKVGLISTYFTLFDEQMPAGFRADRSAAAARCAALLDKECDVIFPGIVASDDDASTVNNELRTHDLDVLVFVPSMVAPPALAERAIEGISVPIVIWNAAEVESLPVDLSQAKATANTTQVASVMFANVLVRRGRFFRVATASPSDAAGVTRVLRLIRGCAGASTVRRTVALRLGEPISGYTDVEVTSAQLGQLAVREVVVSTAELDEEFRLAQPGVREGWRGGADERSLRLATALEALCDRHGATCGSVNCHGGHFRDNCSIGITACLGVSLLAERGVPFSCTGDVPTAIALAISNALSGKALYCEFYTPESESGLMLLAAGGEGDPRWADAARPIRVEPNHHYPGRHGAGAGVTFALQQGPATALSLSPVETGWRLVWSTGEIVETRYDRMGGPNGMFRFDSGRADVVGENWIASGATHHNALAEGRLDIEVPTLAAALGVEAVRI